MIAERTDRRLEWAAGAFVVSMAFMAWWLHWFGLVDLEVYRAGASAFLHGHDIYLARPRQPPLPFTYPPFAALVFVPLAVTGDLAARVGLSPVSGAALLLAAARLLRLAGPHWPKRTAWTVGLLTGAAILVEPLRDTFRLGQINLVLMALVLADLAPARHLPRRSPPARHPAPRRAGGILIGIATAIKLTPAIFILYLLVTRRTRQAANAAGAAIAATALAVLAICLALAARLQRSGDELMGVAVAALAGLLISPISWNHHWTWALPLAMALGRRALVTRRRGDLAIAGGWVATFCLASMSWWPLAGQNDYQLGFGYNVAADGYILATLGAVAMVAAGAWGGGPSSWWDRSSVAAG